MKNAMDASKLGTCNPLAKKSFEKSYRRILWSAVCLSISGMLGFKLAGPSYELISQAEFELRAASLAPQSLMESIEKDFGRKKRGPSSSGESRYTSSAFEPFSAKKKAAETNRGIDRGRGSGNSIESSQESSESRGERIYNSFLNDRAKLLQFVVQEHRREVKSLHGFLKPLAKNLPAKDASEITKFIELSEDVAAPKMDVVGQKIVLTAGGEKMIFEIVDPMNSDVFLINNVKFQIDKRKTYLENILLIGKKLYEMKNEKGSYGKRLERFDLLSLFFPKAHAWGLGDFFGGIVSGVGSIIKGAAGFVGGAVKAAASFVTSYVAPVAIGVSIVATAVDFFRGPKIKTERDQLKLALSVCSKHTNPQTRPQPAFSAYQDVRIHPRANGIYKQYCGWGGIKGVAYTLSWKNLWNTVSGWFGNSDPNPTSAENCSKAKAVVECLKETQISDVAEVYAALDAVNVSSSIRNSYRTSMGGGVAAASHQPVSSQVVRQNIPSQAQPASMPFVSGQSTPERF